MSRVVCMMKIYFFVYEKLMWKILRRDVVGSLSTYPSPFPFMTGYDDDDGDKNGRLHVFVEMIKKGKVDEEWRWKIASAGVTCG